MEVVLVHRDHRKSPQVRFREFTKLCDKDLGIATDAAFLIWRMLTVRLVLIPTDLSILDQWQKEFRAWRDKNGCAARFFEVDWLHGHVMRQMSGDNLGRDQAGLLGTGTGFGQSVSSQCHVGSAESRLHSVACRICGVSCHRVMSDAQSHVGCCTVSFHACPQP